MFFTIPFISIIVRVADTFLILKPVIDAILSIWMGSWDNEKIIFSSSGLSGLIFLLIPVLIISFKFNASKMSEAEVTVAAPVLIKLFVPSEFLLKILPGIANTSLFCSRAKFAVISAPDSFGASTTKVARDRPDIILFLAGNFVLEEAFHKDILK